MLPFENISQSCYQTCYQIESPHFTAFSDFSTKNPETIPSIPGITRIYTPWNAYNDCPDQDSTQEIVYKVRYLKPFIIGDSRKI